MTKIEWNYFIINNQINKLTLIIKEDSLLHIYLVVYVTQNFSEMLKERTVLHQIYVHIKNIHTN